MFRRCALAAVMMVVAGPAQAHVGQHVSFAIGDGFAHPFLGPDHLAAMVAVGLWSALAGGRRLWFWPAAFISAMLVGGFIGRSGMHLPHVEPAIAVSVVVLGLLVTVGLRAPTSAGALVVAAFAIFHGAAHGAEAPTAGWAGYAMGFVFATALLHGLGVGLALLLQRSAGALPVRAIGITTALFGFVILVS